MADTADSPCRSPQVRSMRIGKSILGWAFGALPSGDIQEAQCFLARPLAQPPVVGWRLVLWCLKSNMQCERHARCAGHTALDPHGRAAAEWPDSDRRLFLLAGPGPAACRTVQPGERTVHIDGRHAGRALGISGMNAGVRRLLSHNRATTQVTALLMRRPRRTPSEAALLALS